MQFKNNFIVVANPFLKPQGNSEKREKKKNIYEFNLRPLSRKFKTLLSKYNILKKSSMWT